MIETMTLRATVELKEKLREQAKRKGITVNALILQALWQYFENQVKMN